ncbi:19401_t:CDS:1, partial [Gigaspora rosea]
PDTNLVLPLNTNDLQHQTFTNVSKNYMTSTNYGTGENMI